MQHFEQTKGLTLRIFLLILGLGFTLVTFGCATGKPVSGKNKIADVNVGLKVEAIPEGICITFDNIPAETNRLFIMSQNWKGKGGEQLSGTHDIIGSYTDIMGNTLEQVKQTGRIIFPFVKAGENYHISAAFENKDGKAIAGVPDLVYAECAANAGIYFNDGLELELNKTNTGVTLSSEPEFSKDVQYARDKYRHTVTLSLPENTSLGYSGESSNGLYWDFEPQMTNNFKKGEYLQSGSYSAYVTAYRNVIYDNVTWAVEIAKTPEFIYSVNSVN